VNSIFWGDTASVEGQEIYNSEGALLPDISYSDIEGCNPWDTGIGTDRGGNIDYDPYLDLSYHLMQLSKCIDAGDPDSSTARGFPAYDMDGQVRPNGEAYDIGTDEYYAR
jgi:hypothetical protein